MSGVLIKLQHKTRREGIIRVGGASYSLDTEGCVEVPQKAAEVMLQGAMWRDPSYWAAQNRAAVKAAPPSFSAEKKDGRRARTKEELYVLAASEGLITEPPPGKKEENAEEMGAVEEEIPSQKEEEDEVVEISLSMSKAQLVEVAHKLNIDVAGKTKAQIFELLAAEER
jgi:hypothetical protein